MMAEEQEDMWHAYNLIEVGDSLRATTVRKVTTESSTGSTRAERVHTTLTVHVEGIDFDAHTGALHVKGKNIEENRHVKMGAYHTLDLEQNRKFTLCKEKWDVIHLERIALATDPAARADVAAVVMHEGLAHVCLVTASMTLVRQKIDMAVPRKRKGFAQQHDRGLGRFYEAVTQAVYRHVDFDSVKCVIVASPGFVREQFLDHLWKAAARDGKKSLLDNRSKFVSIHSSNGFKHALKEVLTDSSVAVRLADTKAQAEVRALEQFYETLATEPARAYYGLKHVELAQREKAIEVLLVSDDLFRARDHRLRARYVALVEAVKANNGAVHIFSSLHVSGEQLSQLTGVAALLRFPMPELDDDEHRSDSDEEEIVARPMGNDSSA